MKVFAPTTLAIILLLTGLIFGYLSAASETAADSKEKVKGGAMSSNNPSTVYFTKEISSQGVMKVFEKIRGNVKGKVGLKVHFGEDGNKYYIKPDTMKELTASLNATLIESNVLYPGKRRYTESHIALAKEHGFTFAPIDILDSEADINYKAEGFKHYKEFRFGSHIEKYDTIVALSHFKGHVMGGFGGAIKNISMGLASVSGKMAMHASSVPVYKAEKCVKCGICVKNCPAHAITIEPKLVIDPHKCIGCGKCIGVCPQKVLGVPWGSTSQPVFLERLVEYAKVITGRKNFLYINVIADVSPDCDCMGHAAEPFVKNVGIVASTDIVAIEQASVDLVNTAADCKDAFKKATGQSGEGQLNYAEKLGMGNRKYNLINLDTQNSGGK